MRPPRDEGRDYTLHPARMKRNGALMIREARTLWMGLVLAGLMLVLSASDSSTSSSQQQPRPNILFAVADDWSYGHAGAYGARWLSTPAFDRVARDGVRFTHAYTPNAKCAPSRAILLTGRHSWQLEEAANHMPYFPAKFRGFPEALAAHGYVVGTTGKGWGPGVANDAEGRPRALCGKAYDRRKA